MPVYFVASIRLTDESIYQRYLDRCDEVFARYGGKYLAVDGSPKVLEGNYGYSKTVLIEFETEALFNEWYYSPEYQEIREFRLAGAKCDTVLVRGLPAEPVVKRVDGRNDDLKGLIRKLDAELWEMYPKLQSRYDALNTLPADTACVLLYDGGKAVGCGCLKPLTAARSEIKRMFVDTACRGKGHAKRIMRELETLARENGVKELVLETGSRQTAAIHLYEGLGFSRIPNYGEYEGNTNSICMRKTIGS